MSRATTRPTRARAGRTARKDERPYFVYGTLLDADVRAAVLGASAAALTASPAVLHGYRRVCVAGRSYPMLRQHASASVNGAILTGLGVADEQRLARFEGPEYVLAERIVDTAAAGPVHAAMFLPRRQPPPADDWTFEAWRRLHKRRFLRALAR